LPLRQLPGEEPLTGMASRFHGSVRGAGSVDRHGRARGSRSPDSRVSYDRKRAEGKKHNVAVIFCARRHGDVILTMIRAGELTILNGAL